MSDSLKNSFFTQYVRPITVDGEVNSGEVLVEKDGYMSARQRIEQMILAGERLISARKEQFQYDGDFDYDAEDYEDPVISYGFDRMEALEIDRNLNDKLKKLSKKLKDIEEKEPEKGGKEEVKGGVDEAG